MSDENMSDRLIEIGQARESLSGMPDDHKTEAEKDVEYLYDELIKEREATRQARNHAEIYRDRFIHVNALNAALVNHHNEKQNKEHIARKEAENKLAWEKE